MKASVSDAAGKDAAPTGNESRTLMPSIIVWTVTRDSSVDVGHDHQLSIRPRHNVRPSDDRTSARGSITRLSSRKIALLNVFFPPDDRLIGGAFGRFDFRPTPFQRLASTRTRGAEAAG